MAVSAALNEVITEIVDALGDGFTHDSLEVRSRLLDLQIVVDQTGETLPTVYYGFLDLTHRLERLTFMLICTQLELLLKAFYPKDQPVLV